MSAEKKDDVIISCKHKMKGVSPYALSIDIKDGRVRDFIRISKNRLIINNKKANDYDIFNTDKSLSNYNVVLDVYTKMYKGEPVYLMNQVFKKVIRNNSSGVKMGHQEKFNEGHNNIQINYVVKQM